MINDMGFRERVGFLFEDLDTLGGRLTDIIVLFFILLACVTFVAGTYELGGDADLILKRLELIIGAVFLIEYGLRLWSARNRVEFVKNPLSIIDAIAIIPVFMAYSNLQFLRIIRVFRVFRLLRFLETPRFFFGEMTETLLISARILFTVFAIIFVSAAFMLMAEGDANPGINTFTDGVYFSVVTLTTVGFGDIVPLTQEGRLVTILMISSGIIFVPLELGKLIKKLVASSAKTHNVCEKCGLTHHDKDAIHCKHCGKVIYQETYGE